MIDREEALKAKRTLAQYCDSHFPDCSECIFAIWTEDTGYCVFGEETLPANWVEDNE